MIECVGGQTKEESPVNTEKQEKQEKQEQQEQQEEKKESGETEIFKNDSIQITIVKNQYIIY